MHLCRKSRALRALERKARRNVISVRPMQTRAIQYRYMVASAYVHEQEGPEYVEREGTG